MALFLVLDFSGPKPKPLCDNLDLAAAFKIFAEKAEASQVALVPAGFQGSDAERELSIRMLNKKNDQLNAKIDMLTATRELVYDEEADRLASAAQNAAAKRKEGRDAELAFQHALFAAFSYVVAISNAQNERNRKREQDLSEDQDLGR